MSEQRNPDYVDRCIDFISNRRQRCFADFALWVVMIGALLAFAPNEYGAGAEHRAWKERYVDFVEASRACKARYTGRQLQLKDHARPDGFTKCANS